MIDFPAVDVKRNGQGFEGVAALSLDAILAAELFGPGTPDHVEDRDRTWVEKSLHWAREAFLKALRPWPSFLTLEFRITSLPNIACKTQGVCRIALVIRIQALTSREARKEAIQTFLALQPLLSSHFVEANFLPVTDKSGLKEILEPFRPRHAMGIRRRRDEIELDAPMKPRSLGFTTPPAPKGKRPEGERVIHTCPWTPLADDWSRMLDVLVSLMDPVTLLIRVKPDTDEQSEREIDRLLGVVECCEGYLSRRDRKLPASTQVEPIRDVALERAIGLRSGAFNLGVFLLSPHPINASVAQVVGCSISEGPDLSKLKHPFIGGFVAEKADSVEVVRADHFADPDLYDAREAACAFRLPSPPARQVPGLPIRNSRTLAAVLPQRDSGKPGDDIRLFFNDHQSVRVPVLMNAEDRMRHMFIVGQTGTGKSTLMESMILQDIHAGRGVAVIDPHGDMVENVLACMPPSRAEDLVFFDFLDRDRPIGFNPLAWSTIDERDLLIDEFYQTLDRIYDMRQTGGPIFEMHFRGMMKLLMGDGSPKRCGFVATLLEFMPTYTDTRFRRMLKESVDDPQLSDFLTEMERANGEAHLNNVSPYITSKFSRFVHDSTLKRIMGQARSGFDIEDIMDKGKIFLVRLGKGRFGGSVSALLTNMLISRFKLAAMKRGGKPASERKDFFLYVDEAHNIPGDNFIELLSEARKYRLSLTLATQFCAQLSDKSQKGADLLSAIYGNVGTTVVFRLGPDDANAMAPLLHPYFTKRDVLGLPNYNGYTRMLLDSETRPPFSFRSERTPFRRIEELPARLMALSRLKHGVSGTLIDAEIASRRKRVTSGEFAGPGTGDD